jgi:hypothetical protein
MKNLILLGLMLFYLFGASAQDGKEISGNYYFTKNLPKDYSYQYKELPGQASESDSPVEAINKGAKITILYYDTLQNRVYYQFWNYLNREDSLVYNTGKFYMSYNKFIQSTSPLYPRFKGTKVLAYTVPFRLRGIGDNFDFESSLSLTSNLVFGFGSRYKRESWFDASFGVGLTGVVLNEDNSDFDPGEGDQASRTASAFTLSFGGVLKPRDNINIGLFLGWDFLNAQDRKLNWDYDGKRWVGIGINITFSEVKAKGTLQNAGNQR